LRVSVSRSRALAAFAPKGPSGGVAVGVARRRRPSRASRARNGQRQRSLRQPYHRPRVESTRTSHTTAMHGHGAPPTATRVTAHGHSYTPRALARPPRATADRHTHLRGPASHATWHFHKQLTRSTRLRGAAHAGPMPWRRDDRSRHATRRMLSCKVSFSLFDRSVTKPPAHHSLRAPWPAHLAAR
jgi:hypothetical protein